MEIGTEISQKIRSAIKAKLIELGAYVDDELPDYIMVMVANKRSQQQMADDLNLFLSTNTEKFTVWLHGLLKKLQSINTDQVPTKPKHKEKQKTEKKKHRPSTSEKTTKTATDSSTPESKKEEQKKQKPQGKETDGKERITSTVKTGEAEQPPEINIIENTDEFNEENKAIEKTEPSKPGKPPPGKVIKSEKSDGKKLAAKSQPQDKSGTVTDKEIKKSSKKKPTSFVASVKRKYEEEEEDEEYDPLNPAVGSVASVIRGPTRKSSIPKAMQANRSLLMKAVNDAEKSVTTAKKLEHSSSESSSGMRSDQKPLDLRKRLKTAAGLQLISRSKRKGIKDMTYTIDNDVKKPRKSGEDFTELKYTVKNVPTSKVASQKKVKAPAVAPSRMAASALKEISQESMKEQAKQDEDVEDEEDDGQYGPALPDTRLVHQASKVQTDSNEDSNGYTDSVSDNVTDPEIQKILDDANETDLNLNIESPVSFQEKKSPSPKDPRFIVTLDGVDPARFTDFQEEKTNIIQTVKPMARFPPSQPLLGTMDKFKPTAEPETYSKITPPKIKPFNINLKESDDDEEEDNEEQTSPAATSPSVLERCRFWPACANGSACQYIHPSIPCKTFPYCKFGEKCMYIHPNCKYDAKCTRMDCPFTHASKRSTVHPTVIHKIVQVPMQPYIPTRPALSAAPQTQSNNCKFYPNCTNMNCSFVHPRPCRYGIGCMNKGACTFYHPSLPSKDKLTWTPADKQQPSKGVGEAAVGKTALPASS